MTQTTPAFFNEHERATIDAATARIIPTDRDPGAREAGVVRFIDRYLSGIGHIFANPWGSGFLRLEGKQAEAWTRRIERMRVTYREGIADLDARSVRASGRRFVDLGPGEQDAILAEVSELGEVPRPVPAVATEHDPPANQHTAVAPAAPKTIAMTGAIRDDGRPFFEALVLHTRMGFYGDPVYGGNADRIGWHVIGFPGPASMAETTDGRFSTLEYLTPGEDFYSSHLTPETTGDAVPADAAPTFTS